MNADRCRRPDRCRAFTLVEILIVVVILGVLAAIVIPQFAAATDDARHNGFITDLSALTRAVTAYSAIHGMPPDGSTGVMPVELNAYMAADRYEKATTVGGLWDIEVDDNGVRLAVGVHFVNGDNPGDDAMQEIDAMIDDGVLSTGSFRKIADDRYYNVLR